MEKFGGDEGGRTPYLNAASVALYQLSYVPKICKRQGERNLFPDFDKLIKSFFVAACHLKLE